MSLSYPSGRGGGPYDRFSGASLGGALSGRAPVLGSASRGALGIMRTLSLILLTVFLFIVGTDAISVPLGGDGAAPVRFAKLGAYGGIFVLSLLHVRAFVRGAVDAWPLLLVLVLCGVSVLWSVDRSETVQRLIALYGCSAGGILLAQMLSLRGLVVWLGMFGALIAVASLVAVALIPSARGVPPWPDVWRGIYSHKNGLGAATALLLPFSLHLVFVLRNGLPRFIAILGTLLLALLLAITQSRTSQLISIFGLLAIASAIVLRRRRTGWTMIVLFLFTLGALAIFMLFATGLSASIFEAVGRNPTLSGRLPLWEVLWDYVTERPLLGYGYAAFWDPESRRFFDILRDPTIKFEPYYSHNGFMETVLGIGVLGFALVAFMIVRAFAQIFTVFARRPDAVDLVPVLAVLLCFLMMNISEGPVLKRDNPVWIIVVALIVKVAALASASGEERRRNAKGRSTPARPSGAAGAAGPTGAAGAAGLGRPGHTAESFP